MLYLQRRRRPDSDITLAAEAKTIPTQATDSIPATSKDIFDGHIQPGGPQDGQGRELFNFRCGSEIIRFQGRWQAISGHLISIHRPRLKEEFYRNYLVIGNDYLKSKDEVDFMINGINAANKLPNLETITTFTELKLRESTLRENLGQIRELGARIGLKKRFFQDISDRKVAKKKLVELKLPCHHPRILAEKIQTSEQKTHVLALHEIQEILASIKKEISPKPPAFAQPVVNPGTFRKRRLKPLPDRLPFSLLSIPSLRSMFVRGAATAKARLSESEQQKIFILKGNAKLLDILKVMELDDSLISNSQLIVGLNSAFAQELEKFKICAASYLSLHSLENSHSGYRLNIRERPGEATAAPIFKSEKWLVFDHDLPLNDDYIAFESYLRVFAGFNLEEVVNHAGNTAESSSETSLSAWAADAKHMDRLLEVAQTELAFSLKIQKIITALTEITTAITFNECEKISISHMKACFVRILEQSTSLAATMGDALKFPITRLSADAVKSARVPASLKLFARTKTLEEREECTRAFLETFSGTLFVDQGKLFSEIFAFRHAWAEIKSKHLDSLSALAKTNPNNPYFLEVFGKDHLGGEIFTPVQMRAGRYSLLLKDCKLPPIECGTQALDAAKALAAQANEAIHALSHPES